MRILITGAHGDIACSVAKIIRSEFKNYKIFGVDIENHGPGDLLFDNVFKIPNIKNNPIMAGALPKGNESQRINFITKKQSAIKMLTHPNKNPNNEAILIGTFE